MKQYIQNSIKLVNVNVEQIQVFVIINNKCRKDLVDNLFEECSENIDQNEMFYNETLNDQGRVWNSCTI